VDDALATVRKQCPSIDATGVQATVKGSIYFLGTALERDVTAAVSGTLVIPAACSAGQCPTVEAALKSAFDTATCTAQAGGCSCPISKIDHVVDATTYTLNGNTVTTDGGEVYSICESASTLTYNGSSAGAEKGTFTLKKR
jgi:hypothetical protein